nr:hypothetical protein CFP56_79623 [Quercus suber]
MTIVVVPAVRVLTPESPTPVTLTPPPPLPRYYLSKLKASMVGRASIQKWKMENGILSERAETASSREAKEKASAKALKIFLCLSSSAVGTTLPLSPVTGLET